MLVGDVRWATVVTGCSCQLSGGSQWSSGPTKVSKNAHVLRARPRRKSAWSIVSRASRRASGRLTHHAMPGEMNHRKITGAACANADGSDSATRIAAAVAMTGAIHIDVNGVEGSVSAADGFHSRSR